MTVTGVMSVLLSLRTLKHQLEHLGPAQLEQERFLENSQESPATSNWLPNFSVI